MVKKLFTTAVMLVAMTSSWAQIKVEESFANNLIIIGNLSVGRVGNLLGDGKTRLAEHKLYCRIFHDKTTYGILVDTENLFDDDFEFALGTDIDKAKESLSTILEFMRTNPLKTSITVTDEDDRVIQLNLIKRTTISLDAIDAHGVTIVNKVYLKQSNLERALKLLDGKAERKVQEAIVRNSQTLN